MDQDKTIKSFLSELRQEFGYIEYAVVSHDKKFIKVTDGFKRLPKTGWVKPYIQEKKKEPISVIRKGKGRR